MRPYDLLVFDWDGTLVDSISSIVECTQHALREAGAPAVADDTIRRTIGLGIREMVDELVPGCDDALFEHICLAYRDQWFSAVGTQHQPFAGTDELLAGLGARGYLLGVASAKSRRGLETDFVRTALGRHFHASRTVDEAPPKPHPGMLEGLIDQLGSRVERTLMIGDTAHDLEMAANAGTAAVGILGGSHDREQLEMAAPLVVLDCVLDLSAWLGSRA
ncbi:MAG: HAD-IA family hydrolase [Acidobacteria bacterium]|nr:HAD-IA family hydrolase [Acidobacteriota bacterium]